mgnify:CR=1 FL=1
MSELIQTIDCDRWSEPENHRVKHIGMIPAKDAFDQLYTHLQAKDMLPDEYFLFSETNFPGKTELPDFSTAVCHTDFGGSEGIYFDIELNCRDKQIHFATGKTLDESADAFFLMSRIAAECSLMLNGRGSSYKKENVEAVFTPEESLALGELVSKRLCEYTEPEEEKLLVALYDKVFPDESLTTDSVQEQTNGIEP